MRLVSSRNVLVFFADAVRLAEARGESLAVFAQLSQHVVGRCPIRAASRRYGRWTCSWSHLTCGCAPRWDRSWQRVVRPVRQAASGNRGKAARSCASESSWSSGKARRYPPGWLLRHPSVGSQCLHWLNPGTSPRRNESCDGSRHSENHKRER